MKMLLLVLFSVFIKFIGVSSQESDERSAYDSDGKLSVPVTAGVATATGIAIVALVFLIEHIRRKYQGTPTEAEEQETKYDRTVPDKYFIDPNEDTELPMKLL